MREPSLINQTCAECRQDLEHCHGTAILHWEAWGAGGAWSDCADDPDCRLAAEQHQFVISCSEAGCDCEAGQQGAGWEQSNWPPEHAAAS